MAKSKSKAVAEPAYEPSERETAALEVVADKLRAKGPAPYLKMDFDEETRSVEVSYDHEDQTTAQALSMFQMGTGDTRFHVGLVHQISALGEHGKPVSETASNFALSVIRGVQPTDEVEAMLATQMAAVHQSTMMMARRLNHVVNIPQQDAAERALNKLARTFATQVQTLKKYRSKGEQIVRVERVTVEDGGRAIVGAVQTGGRGKDET